MMFGKSVVITFKPTGLATEEELETYPIRFFEMIRANRFLTVTETSVHRINYPNGTLNLYTPEEGDATFSLRFYRTNRVFVFTATTLNSNVDNGNLLYYMMHRIKDKIEEVFETRDAQVGPIVNLSKDSPRYFQSSNDRALEYDFDRMVVHETTPYQDVKICHSETFGNVLVLDDLINMGESDISYTRALMNQGKVNYRDKEVLVLGGGDGGLLNLLLKESPKFVTMIDIDEVVLKTCSKHMREVAGDALDNLEGPNHQVIVGDCVEYLKRYVAENRIFDCIINDLTDLPLSKRDDFENLQLSFHLDGTDHLELVEEIIDLAFKILKTGGVYLNHACGTEYTDGLEVYEEALEERNLKFTRYTRFVPSFQEEWSFYQIIKS